MTATGDSPHDVHVAHLGDDDASRWDAYVGPRTGTVTDLFAWRRVVQQAYGIRSHFLAAIEDGRITSTNADPAQFKH